MSTLMSERPRMYFDADDELRWAIKLRVGKVNATSSTDLVREILMQELADELAEVRRLMAEGHKPAPKRAGGRKPKGAK